MNTKIIIATTKYGDLPNDDIFLPLHVGAKDKESIGYERDDSGDNISNKNGLYCELTGLYWAWKNINADAIGLMHYRRFLMDKNHLFYSDKQKIEHVISSDTIQRKLNNKDLILPKKRRYFVTSLYNHYSTTHYEEHLLVTRDIISEKCPEYLKSFDRLKRRTSAHMFNMMVVNKKVFDKYCTWLFDILFELEKRVDYDSYSPYHKRMFGRMSELLLDVYIETNELTYAEVPWAILGKVNYRKKVKSFIKTVLFKKKYEGSF